MGILPTILHNLLDARKKTNRQIEVLKKQLDNSEDKSDIEREITVLDKRQLALKVSANSMYGGMGVKRGYLPFMPGAMCTTAKGRQSIDKTAKYISSNYKGDIIYGDTDSVYVHFPHLHDAKDTWDFCVKVESEIQSLYIRPMKLAFEEKIYWRYFILTKKRYMALTCDFNDVVSNKIFKRGVLLARRDNSKFLRELYGDMIMKIFYKEDMYIVCNLIIDRLNEMFSGSFGVKNFIVTKSVGDVADYVIRPLHDSSKDVMKITKEANIEQSGELLSMLSRYRGGRTTPVDKESQLWPIVHKYMSKAMKNVAKKLNDLEIGDYEGENDVLLKACAMVDEAIKEELDEEQRHTAHYDIAKSYIGKCLPAQVQLAERMRKRGQPVDAGTRLEYTVIGEPTDRLFDKMEDVVYFNSHRSVLRLDFIYYLKLAINPVDQALEVAYNIKGFMSQQYKLRVQKAKVMKQLLQYFKPTLLFVD
jgi:DNA polymerase elongation subunit (family B)